MIVDRRIYAPGVRVQTLVLKESVDDMRRAAIAQL